MTFEFVSILKFARLATEDEWEQYRRYRQAHVAVAGRLTRLQFVDTKAQEWECSLFEELQIWRDLIRGSKVLEGEPGNKKRKSPARDIVDTETKEANHDDAGPNQSNGDSKGGDIDITKGDNCCGGDRAKEEGTRDADCKGDDERNADENERIEDTTKVSKVGDTCFCESDGAQGTTSSDNTRANGTDQI